jgi:hypothetical protein
MHPRVQYAQWEGGSGGSNSRWLEWRRVVLVALLLAVAVVTIESDLVPEIGHRIDGSNWVAESKEQETTEFAKVPSWVSNEQDLEEFLQDEESKGHKVVRHKNGKTFKKNIPSKALPKKGMKALIKKAVKKAVKKGGKKKTKHKVVKKKTTKKAKKAKKKAVHAMPPVPQHHAAKKKRHFLTLKKPLKPPAAVKKTKRHPHKGPWKDGNPKFSNDPPWKKGTPWKKGNKKKKAKKAKAKKKAVSELSFVDELEFAQGGLLPSARIAGALRRIDIAQKRAARRKAERKMSKRRRRKLRLARMMARRSRQKRKANATRVRTLANIRALKAYCMGAKETLVKNGYMSKDAFKKGPLAQLIIRFGNKSRKNLVEEYAKVMGRLKRDFRQFRGFLIRHLDQGVVYGSGVVKKTLISSEADQLRGDGGKDHLVVKFGSKRLGLLNEPTYFNKMAVPYKVYMKHRTKVLASSRHAGLKVTASLLRKQGAKSRRIFFRRIHSHYMHKLASMRHRVEHAAYKAGMRKWHNGKKVVKRHTVSVPTASLNGAQRYRDRNWRKLPSLSAQQKRAKKMARAYMRHHGRRLRMVDYIKKEERKIKLRRL